MKNSISLWQLLNKSKIEIPIIQRDYAQGRIGKEKLRQNFLSHIKKAFEGSNAIQLDFIYGTCSHGAVTPLDGQQRLTTLWLVHWYIAYMGGFINDKKVVERLRNFSYETRDSSKDFCRELASFKEQIPEGKGISITEHIRNQSWFSSFWKQDPTVQAMLRMIGGSIQSGEPLGDGIAQVFSGCDFKSLWGKITSDNCPVTFYFLDLDGFKQPDDLYLKMNARGEQLTDFENFKADLNEFISDQDENGDKEYNKLNSIETGMSIKIDRNWSGIFWNGDHGDEAFMAFINRFFCNHVILEKTCKDEDGNQSSEYVHTGKDFEEKAEKHNEAFDHFYGRSPKEYVGTKCIDDSRISYSDFSVFKYSAAGTIPSGILSSLEKTFDGYLIFQSITKTNDEDAQTYDFAEKARKPWSVDFSFIPAYDESTTVNFKDEEIRKIKPITQTGRVAFHAICRFMEKVADAAPADRDILTGAFTSWMRVVWNLVSDSRMRSITSMVSQLQLVDSIPLDINDIYKGITDMNANNSVDDEGTILNERFNEEQIKADKIRHDKQWEAIFLRDEEHEFNRGTVRFLYLNGSGKIDWDDYQAKAERIPWDEMTITEKDHLKEFVSYCTTWEELKQIEYDSRRETWLRNLTNKELLNVVHNYLMNSSEKGFSDSERSDVFKDLTETDLLKNMKYNDGHVNGCHLREDKYSLIALFPYNAKSEMKKFVLGNKRNETMAKLIKSGYICGQRVKDTDIFWGWDTTFKRETSGQKFLWSMALSQDKWVPTLSAMMIRTTGYLRMEWLAS